MSNIAVHGYETGMGNIKEEVFFIVPFEEGIHKMEKGLFFCVAKDGESARIAHLATDGETPIIQDFLTDSGRIGDWEVVTPVQGKRWHDCQYEASW